MPCADGSTDRLLALAAETVEAKPDVVVTVTTSGALAMKKATSTIPVVAIGPADPVRSGLVASLARPGGNLTGLSPNQAEIAGKWLELAGALVPGVWSIVYLTDTANPGEMLVFRDLERRAQALGITMQPMNAIDASNIEEAFATMATRRPDAIVVATSASLVPHRRQIVDAVAGLRIPAIYARQEYPEAGGLASYGADSRALWVQAADYVDRILRGSAPADLPFQMASTYRLVVNAGSAARLGLAVPDAVRARADAVIE
jgi:putative ABC transport system substrate-binding protein